MCHGGAFLCQGGALPGAESLRGVSFLISERKPKENQGADTGLFKPLSSAPWTPENVRAAVRVLGAGKT